ncbi:Holliday junction resolvase RuvX [Candidatus Peregrinibacteria bacterium]|nr:MAG: Holliday junction resolvase RuvX [Candidatus Peregrinibacteria bacterium]
MLLPIQGKILALDLGTRRTGVAISDVKQTVAFARPEIEHKNTKELLEQIQRLATSEPLTGLLLGRPTKLDGEATEQTRLVEEAAEALQTLGLPMEFMDERLSTQFAQNLHGFQTKESHHDSRAAQILLETHLSSLSSLGQ